MTTRTNEYAEALEGAADLIDEWVVVRYPGAYDSDKAARVCRALAKAMRVLPENDDEIWLSRDGGSVRLP